MRLIIIAVILMFFFIDTAMASNNSAGLGEAFLLFAILITIFTTISVITGAVIAGRRAKQRHKNVVWGIFLGALLGLLPIVLGGLFVYCVFVLPSQISDIQDKQEETVYKEWLMPLENLKAGEVRSTLKLLLNTKPDTRYQYYNHRLLDGLTEKLKSFTEQSLTQDDLAALNSFFVTFEAMSRDKSELQAAIVWVEYFFDVAPALQACNTNEKCQFYYIQQLSAVCEDYFATNKVKFTRCKQSLSFEEIRLLLNTLKPLPHETDIKGLESFLVYFVAKSLPVDNVRYSIEELLLDDRVQKYPLISDYLIKSLQQFEKSISLEDKQALDKFIAKVIEVEKQNPYAYSPIGDRKFYPSRKIVELKSMIIWAYYRLATADAISECANNDECSLPFYTEQLINYCKLQPTICNNETNRNSINYLAKVILSSKMYDKEKIHRELLTLI